MIGPLLQHGLLLSDMPSNGVSLTLGGIVGRKKQMKNNQPLH